MISEEFIEDMLEAINQETEVGKEVVIDFDPDFSELERRIVKTTGRGEVYVDGEYLGQIQGTSAEVTDHHVGHAVPLRQTVISPRNAFVGLLYGLGVNPSSFFQFKGKRRFTPCVTCNNPTREAQCFKCSQKEKKRAEEA